MRLPATCFDLLLAAGDAAHAGSLRCPRCRGSTGSVIPWRAAARRDAAFPCSWTAPSRVGAIDVDATGADFYTVSGQKWLCGPDATGALYVRDPESTPARGSSPTRAPRATTSPRARGSRRRARGASTRRLRRSSSLAGARGGAHRVCRTGASSERASSTERCRALPAAQRVTTSSPRPGQGTLVSFRFDGDTAEAAAALYARGVVIRELPGTGLLRASVGWWNDE